VLTAAQLQQLNNNLQQQQQQQNQQQGIVQVGVRVGLFLGNLLQKRLFAQVCRCG